MSKPTFPVERSLLFSSRPGANDLAFFQPHLDAAAPGSARPAAGSGVVDFRLDNGLTVVVIPDRRAPVVTHMVWYRNGSADDPWASRASPISSNI